MGGNASAGVFFLLFPRSQVAVLRITLYFVATEWGVLMMCAFSFELLFFSPVASGCLAYHLMFVAFKGCTDGIYHLQAPRAARSIAWIYARSLATQCN